MSRYDLGNCFFLKRPRMIQAVVRLRQQNFSKIFQIRFKQWYDLEKGIFRKRCIFLQILPNLVIYIYIFLQNFSKKSLDTQAVVGLRHWYDLSSGTTKAPLPYLSLCKIYHNMFNQLINTKCPKFLWLPLNSNARSISDSQSATLGYYAMQLILCDEHLCLYS